MSQPHILSGQTVVGSFEKSSDEKLEAGRGEGIWSGGREERRDEVSLGLSSENSKTRRKRDSVREAEIDKLNKEEGRTVRRAGAGRGSVVLHCCRKELVSELLCEVG